MEGSHFRNFVDSPPSLPLLFQVLGIDPGILFSVSYWALLLLRWWGKL